MITSSQTVFYCYNRNGSETGSASVDPLTDGQFKIKWEYGSPWAGSHCDDGPKGRGVVTTFKRALYSLDSRGYEVDTHPVGKALLEFMRKHKFRHSEWNMSEERQKLLDDFLDCPKLMYFSPQEANEALESLKSHNQEIGESNEGLEVYVCKACECFHLGHRDI